MIGLSMRHLRYFDALAQHGHFGRAAQACAISQPALSLQMQELEALLGAPLIERGARQIRLTSLGEAFALRVRDILRSVDELGDLARASFSPLAGRLRIGVIPPTDAVTVSSSSTGPKSWPPVAGASPCAAST